MRKISVTVEGFTGTGKTAILFIIEKALKNAGLRLILSDKLEQERNLGHPETMSPEDLTKLAENVYIELVEKNVPISPT